MEKSEKPTLYVGCQVQPPLITVDGIPTKMNLPDGCFGYLLAWTDIEKAKKWYNDDSIIFNELERK